ncbi:MAG: hypothetical protein NWE89_01525 [Candidatus Bathyarchaeota archaeon]|nr:hypothetical protein [Candidatus Bathyarchaeota archaeon]
MKTRTLNRLKLELQSFKALVIANLVGAALSLAFSMAYGVPKLIPFMVEGVLEIQNLPYLGLILVGFIVALNWIITSAELMGTHDEIVKNLDKVDPDDEEAITGIIVQSIAFYRENQIKIEKLAWGSRITGAFLLLAAVPQLRALITGVYPFGGVEGIAQLFGLAANLGIGFAGLYAPTVIHRFTETWDMRISFSEEANEKLSSILEGTQ